MHLSGLTPEPMKWAFCILSGMPSDGSSLMHPAWTLLPSFLLLSTAHDALPVLPPYF